MAALAVACSTPYDDTELWNSVDELEQRMSAVESVLRAYNNNLFIETVTENTDGYVITFSDGSSATITNGKDGQDGADGKDGKDGIDGQDGEDGKDGIDGQDGEDGQDGNDGEDGKDGQDGDDGDTLIESIEIGAEEVTFTLTDGRTFSIPIGAPLDIEFDAADLVVMSPSSTRNIGYTITSVTTPVVVEVNSSADIKAKVIPNGESSLIGEIQIKTGATIDEYSKVIVLVANGDKVIMRSLYFEEEGLQIVDNATKNAPAEGGEVALEFLSNVECEVVIPEDAQSWISVAPQTRALEEQTITLVLQPNTEYDRRAVVSVKSAYSSLAVEYTIEQPNINLLSATYIPDPVFLAYCEGQMTSWDINEDGELSPVEAAQVKSIYVINKDVSSMTGIEYFTGMTTLQCYDNNKLTSLDVSKCVALTYLRCTDNILTSLNLSGCAALTILSCDSNQLTSLDVSKNTALTWLACYNNQLTSLDISKNSALTILSCDSNLLTSLDVSKNSALTNLGCSDNQLTSLDVSKNSALTSLNCTNNQLTSMDISNNTELGSDGEPNCFVIFNNPGDGISTFPVKAWFDNSSIPFHIDPRNWDWNGNTITLNFYAE
jgi:hypothetical protein